MNIEEQLKLYQSMQYNKYICEQQVRNIAMDMQNLKNIIIQTCTHESVTKIHEHDGHKSTITIKCNICNFYI